jgi:hypothetical protein
MNHFKMLALVSVMVLSVVVGAGVAGASPTDGYATWSMGGLRVAEIHQAGDNDVLVQFRNPDGTIRNYWPNASGTDICGGAASLRVARARTNFKEMVEGLNIAGLSGRNLHVWYEPTGGVCYIKSFTTFMQ